MTPIPPAAGPFATAGSALRPLGIGEILDRAVNLCVRNFLRLGLIYIVFMIPLAFVQYFAFADLSTMLQALGDGSKAGSPAGSQEILRHLAERGPNPFATAGLFVLLLCSPLPAAALLVAAAGFYFGRDTSFGATYAAGLKRFGQLLGVSLLYFIVLVVVYLIVVLLVIAVAFGIAFLYSASSVLGIAAGVIVGLILVVALLALLVLGSLAAQLAYAMIVVDGINFAVAFTRSLATVFAPAGLARSLLVGVAFFAIVAGIAIVASLGQGLFIGLLHAPILGVIYGAVVRVCSAAFTTAFIVIYYYDLRVRGEGLDLAIAAGVQTQQMIAAETLPPSP